MPSIEFSHIYVYMTLFSCQMFDSYSFLCFGGLRSAYCAGVRLILENRRIFAEKCGIEQRQLLIACMSDLTWDLCLV